MTDTPNELLALIGLTEPDFARFRNVHVEGDRVCVETRLGGGNLDCDTWPGQTCEEAGCYHLVVERLRALTNYLGDEEDDGDRTYLYFYFAPIPQESTR